MIRQWTAVCDKVWMYGYNYTMLVNKGTLTPMVHRVREMIPRLKEWAMIGFHDQDEGEWSLCGFPTRVVRAALEWDTRTDVDALLDDTFRSWYGSAAGPMRQYHDALEAAFSASQQHGHEDVILPGIYTDALMAVLDTRIHQAEQVAQEPAVQQRLKLDRLMHDHLKEYVTLEKAKQACRYGDASRSAVRMIAIKDELNQITPFMGWYPYPAYDAAWERDRMDRIAALCDGRTGRLLVALPAQAAFRADPFDDGHYAGWQATTGQEKGWTPVRVTTGWENQGYRDDRGHPYRGIAWYRFRLDLGVDVSKMETGAAVHLFAPAVVNEAWVWVNGEYAGHRPYIVPWSRPQEIDLPISRGLRPGRENTITVRVLCNSEVFGANGIYERPFLYVPNHGHAV